MNRVVRPGSWRFRLHEVIFEADTPKGKVFDVALLLAIIASVLVVSLESVSGVSERFGPVLRGIEWVLTIGFTVEYILRLMVIGQPLRYARSFFGIVDLLAILPTYISLFVAGSQSLAVIRALRLLRVFRVLKLMHFVGEERMLHAALRASMRKIIIFVGTVLVMVFIVGSVMYLLEGSRNGFTSIPQSVYWAIVTMTTVGYGDIAPQTVAGKFVASALMILGYGIIAVPTGIVTVEIAQAYRGSASTQACLSCAAEGHTPDARYCHQCAAVLRPEKR